MINIFWFRRDLRLHDNYGLYRALAAGLPVELLFIFDSEILEKLENKQDARVTFIHNVLKDLNATLKSSGASIRVEYGKPLNIFEKIISQQEVNAVFANEDYEPYALQRDNEVGKLLKYSGITFLTFKDHVIFSPGEVMKDDGRPYTVFTPFANKWKRLLLEEKETYYPSEKYLFNLTKSEHRLPDLESIGFIASTIEAPKIRIETQLIGNYENTRNFPAIAGTSMAGVHLRFGTVSIRHLVRLALSNSVTWLNELIWREFFIHVLYHFPHSAAENFNPRYNRLNWRNNEEEFRRWCDGQTGFPLVDAGMRELNTTAYMHNRVRMVTASFLTKHLLIDWRWGEAYFASRLLDFELASNVGNWQWAAGTGCDAAPYFRVFNPSEQLKKFDNGMEYVRKWVPEFDQPGYLPMLDHAMARQRAIATYKAALG
ncbi:MAG TPA: deoxyribodipyrimidine photo-lyase [Bacteroidales bacterium]|nr:deoxyribodipyrimidine photo-lyase [Bacteroidales bacterium]